MSALSFHRASCFLRSNDFAADWCAAGEDEKFLIELGNRPDARKRLPADAVLSKK